MSLLNLSVILATVFMSACAQLLFKMGVESQDQSAGLFGGGFMSIVRVLFSPMVFSGLVIYGLSVVVWLWVLSRVELSVAYPFVGLSFIFTLLFGLFFLGETLSYPRVIGTALIALGCVFVAYSGQPAT